MSGFRQSKSGSRQSKSKPARSHRRRSAASAPHPTIVTIPCRTRQHRVCVTPRGTVRFLDHRRSAVHLESALGDPQGCAVVHHVVIHQLGEDALPDAIRDAINARYLGLRDEVDEEWQRCWHNATLPTLPYDDDEAELFWDQLGIAVGDACRDLSDEIYEIYEERLTFYQYGRSGATIAPSEWMAPAAHSHFGSFHGSLDDHNYDDFTYEFPRIQTVLAILRYSNAYWRKAAASVEDWWAEERHYV